jgi:phosphoribosylamine--glycine ligase
VTNLVIQNSASIPAAKLQAYKAVKCIRWEGAWRRKDISDKALEYGKARSE